MTTTEGVSHPARRHSLLQAQWLWSIDLQTTRGLHVSLAGGCPEGCPEVTGREMVGVVEAMLKTYGQAGVQVLSVTLPYEVARKRVIRFLVEDGIEVRIR